MCKKVCLIAAKEGEEAFILEKGERINSGRRGLYDSVEELAKKIPQKLINDINDRFKIVTLDVNDKSILHHKDNYSLLPNSNAVITNVESISNIIN